MKKAEEEKVLLQSITERQYGALVSLYSVLNARFFGSELPDVMFTLDYSHKTAKGYFHFEKLKDKQTGEKRSLIAFNPDMFDLPTEEIVSTMLHEQCHCWESYSDIEHQPRGAYHDKKWANKMKSFGLDPVYLNKSRTSCTHTVVENGIFDVWYKDLPEDARESIILVTSAFGEVAAGTGKDSSRNKVKYICPKCGCKVWGRPGLDITCTPCESSFEEES